jgi:ubiquinone/menaquinone biosynthesis C-methylase UbiE
MSDRSRRAGPSRGAERSALDEVPDFSTVARHYARARPRYPGSLFSFLRSLVARGGLAWDCATGTGQAAIELVEHFDRVVGTDVSAEQLRLATPHPRIEYRQAPAEQSGLDASSVDLVAVAAAVHWFDLPRFLAEVRRVLRPGGALAVWTYHVAHGGAPFTDLLWRLYRDHLFADFAAGARLVDARYETLQLPAPVSPVPQLEATAEWSFHQMVEFIRSWSGSYAYQRRTGQDPVDLIREDLARRWGPPERVHTLRWPVYLRVSRL